MGNIKRITKNVLTDFYTFSILIVIIFTFILLTFFPTLLVLVFDNEDFSFLYFLHLLVLFYFMGKEYNE